MKKIILPLLVVISSCLFAQENEKIRAEHYNLDDNVAISGYDPVSYFSDMPIEGKSSVSHTYNGITYYFSNEENKKKFVGNPEKYEPVYGGWCAYAMGLDKAEKVSINPKTFKIIDNQLYLYYNKLGVNTLNKWNKDEENYKAKADKNWSNITGE